MKRSYSLLFALFSCFIFITQYAYAQCGSIEGLSCDDGSICTENDIWVTDDSGPNGCLCIGTLIDAGSPCDDGDPLTDNDVIQSDCSCAGEAICIPGEPCDDGSQTIGYNYNSECECVFRCGYMEGQPCDDGDECTQSDYYRPTRTGCACKGTPISGCCTVGATCDDGDPSTRNDVYDADCNCAGFKKGSLNLINPRQDNSPNIEHSLENGGDTSSNLEGINNLAIAPNPVIDEMTIILGNEIKGNAQLQIITLDGSRIINKQFHNLKSTSLNVQELTEGTYMVIISTDNEVYNQKFVKL